MHGDATVAWASALWKHINCINYQSICVWIYYIYIPNSTGGGNTSSRFEWSHKSKQVVHIPKFNSYLITVILNIRDCYKNLAMYVPSRTLHF